MRKIFFLLFVCFSMSLVLVAQDNTAVARATKMAQESQKIRNGMNILNAYISEIRDTFIRRNAYEAVNHPYCPVYHRKGLDKQDMLRIIDELRAENLIPDGDTNTGMVLQGIFPDIPAVKGVPVAPQPFIATPGGGIGDHHNYPGGLVIHEAAAMTFAASMGNHAEDIYGIDPCIIDNDLLISTMIWHDWAKVFLYQYHEDGTLFEEYLFGGNGQTDNYGSPGNSVTLGHHILSVAELISRDFPKKHVIALASVHSDVLTRSEFRIVNFIRAASIIAGCDPVERGYLYEDGKGRLRVQAGISEKNIHDGLYLSGELQQLPEYVYCHLADWDWAFNNAASGGLDDILERFAPEFGFDPDEPGPYYWEYRYKIYTNYTSEALYMVYCTEGLEAVKKIMHNILN